MKIISESSKDIQQYLDIISGKTPNNNESELIKIESSIQHAVGEQYIVENGTKWIELLEETSNGWKIQQGLIEHNADELLFISKNLLNKNIMSGEFKLHEYKEEFDLVCESLVKTDDYNHFMERVDRYLLVNYELESNDIQADWKMLYESGMTVSEAAEDAYGNSK